MEPLEPSTEANSQKFQESIMPYPMCYQYILDVAYNIKVDDVQSTEELISRNSLFSRKFLFSLITTYNFYNQEDTILIQNLRQEDLDLSSRVHDYLHRLQQTHKITKLYSSTVRKYNIAPLEAKKIYKRSMLTAEKAIAAAEYAEDISKNSISNEWRSDGRDRFSDAGLAIYEEAAALAVTICQRIQNALVCIEDPHPERIYEVENILGVVDLEDFELQVDGGLENLFAIDFCESDSCNSSGSYLFMDESLCRNRQPKESRLLSHQHREALQNTTSSRYGELDASVAGKRATLVSLNSGACHTIQAEENYNDSKHQPEDKWATMLMKMTHKNKSYPMLVGLYLYQLELKRHNTQWDKRVIFSLERILAASERGFSVEPFSWEGFIHELMDYHNDVLDLIEGYNRILVRDIKLLDGETMEILERVVEGARIAHN